MRFNRLHHRQKKKKLRRLVTALNFVIALTSFGLFYRIFQGCGNFTTCPLASPSSKKNLFLRSLFRLSTPCNGIRLLWVISPNILRAVLAYHPVNHLSSLSSSSKTPLSDKPSADNQTVRFFFFLHGTQFMFCVVIGPSRPFKLLLGRYPVAAYLFRQCPESPLFIDRTSNSLPVSRVYSPKTKDRPVSRLKLSSWTPSPNTSQKS